MNAKVVAPIAAAAVAVGLMSTGAVSEYGTGKSEPDVMLVTLPPQALQEGQYIGPCSVVTPPDPDPCEAAQGMLRYAFLGELVNSIQFNKWKNGSPKDYARLNAIMSDPKCPKASDPQPQTMVTPFGAAIADAVQAYACALGTEPVTWPAPNPPLDPNRKDKKPPTAPGPIQVTPNG